MTTDPVQYSIQGSDSASLTRSIEHGVMRGELEPGQPVPSVRALARKLELSPTTVAAVYRDLRVRGVLVTHDRSRTVVAHRSDLAPRLAPDVPAGAIDLAGGNPDPLLLPHLGPAFAQVTASHRRYGDPPSVEQLLDLARADLAADQVPPDHLAVVGGALDGIERVLEVHCRIGDRIAMEDPGYVGSLDLIRALGLQPVPVAIDDDGPDVASLEAALESGVTAFILVPRAQNPTGAALTQDRAAQIRDLLAAYPDVLVIEDDHASWVSGAEHHRVADDRERWVVVRSVAKSLGPDLRVALLAGDAGTVARVTGRQRLGTGWVSHLLQHLAAAVWVQADGDGTLAHASATYAERREALIGALAALDITSHGKSGLNVWVPVAEEFPVAQGLLMRGWAVQAGEPFRLTAPPAIRITVAALAVDQAPLLAADLAQVLDHRLGTRRG